MKEQRAKSKEQRHDVGFGRFISSTLVCAFSASFLFNGNSIGVYANGVSVASNEENFGVGRKNSGFDSGLDNSPADDEEEKDASYEEKSENNPPAGEQATDGKEENLGKSLKKQGEKSSKTSSAGSLSPSNLVKASALASSVGALNAFLKHTFGSKDEAESEPKKEDPEKPEDPDPKPPKPKSQPNSGNRMSKKNIIIVVCVVVFCLASYIWTFYRKRVKDNEKLNELINSIVNEAENHQAYNSEESLELPDMDEDSPIEEFELASFKEDHRPSEKLLYVGGCFDDDSQEDEEIKKNLEDLLKSEKNKNGSFYHEKVSSGYFYDSDNFHSSNLNKS